MKNKIECSMILLGKSAYKVFLSKYDSRAGQSLKWEENISHSIKLTRYNGFMVDEINQEMPIFRLDGTILPLLKQVVSAEYFKKGYSGGNLEKAACSISTLVLKLKSGAEIQLHQFKIPSGSTYGSLECMDLKDYSHFESLHNATN